MADDFMSGAEEAVVFVVEDEPETRESFVALISSMGLPVAAFASGEEFLERIDLERSGCAVVDFRLRGLDGIEVQRRLVEAGCHIPVILISGFLTVRATAGAMEQGVFRVLEKPYRDDELAKAVQDAIGRDRALRRQKRYRLDLRHRLEAMDARERRTLDLILAGHPNKAIERRLGLSRRTVERLRSSILTKTNFLSFVELSAAIGENKTAEGPHSHQIAAECCTPPQVPDSARPAESGQNGSDHGNEGKPSLPGCDLHDGPAQYLSAALMRLQAMEAEHRIAPAARPHLQTAKALLEAALRNIRGNAAGPPPRTRSEP